MINNGTSIERYVFILFNVYCLILLIIALCISNIISSLYYFHMICGMLQFVCTLHHKLYNITHHYVPYDITQHHVPYDITHHHVLYDITHHTFIWHHTSPCVIWHHTSNCTRWHHTVLYDITHHCAIWHHTSLCCMTSHITLSKVMYLVLVATCCGQFHEFMYSTCRLNKLFYILWYIRSIIGGDFGGFKDNLLALVYAMPFVSKFKYFKNKEKSTWVGFLWVRSLISSPDIKHNYTLC